MRIALSPAYYIFWRIDTSDNGPYLSFRMYEDYDKNNEKLTFNAKDFNFKHGKRF